MSDDLFLSAFFASRDLERLINVVSGVAKRDNKEDMGVKRLRRARSEKVVQYHSAHLK